MSILGMAEALRHGPNDMKSHEMPQKCPATWHQCMIFLFPVLKVPQKYLILSSSHLQMGFACPIAPDPGVLGVAIALQCLGLVEHHGISGLTRPLERPLLHGLGGLGGLRLGILLACDKVNNIYLVKALAKSCSLSPFLQKWRPDVRKL